MRCAPCRPRSGAVALVTACVLGAWLGAAQADPFTDYILHCRGCHRPDGSGVAGAAPSFRGQLGKFLWVPGGREYLMRVPGTAQSELSDARTAALLNWMLHEFSAEEIPTDFVPFSEEEVAHYRRPPLTDAAARRRQLLQAIAAQRGKR
jgi:mono/diheme cytochrome c family protein